MVSGFSEACGFGASSATSPLAHLAFKRRPVGPHDVYIKIAYCGVCHSDLHTVRNEWGGATYPIVPGHEIVGHVQAVGQEVKKHKIGDTVGVGCLVDSCRTCESCKKGLEQYCGQMIMTYNSPATDGTGPITMGGYSDHVVVNEEFVVRLPSTGNLAAIAPLLCAGITTYSPLRHWGVTKGTKVGVVGLGGLGHVAVKLAYAMGAEVTVFTTSVGKADDAKKLGAHHVVVSKEANQMDAVAGTLDIIIDTVGSAHDLSPYIAALTVSGTYILVGLPAKPHPPVPPFLLITGRKSVAGSLIGGLPETQEMIDFCVKHNIVADIELISPDYINEAYERMLKSDVRYRFVIDMSKLATQ